MTTKELTLYVELQEKFERSVDHVTTVLSKIPKYYDDFYTYDKVWLDTSEGGDFGEVHTEGADYCGEYHGHFDAEMLTWSDEKLEKYVNGILDKEKKSEEERKQKLEEAERKEYERLKEKFENTNKKPISRIEFFKKYCRNCSYPHCDGVDHMPPVCKFYGEFNITDKLNKE